MSIDKKTYPTESDISGNMSAAVDGVLLSAEILGSVIPGVGMAKDMIIDRFITKPLEDRRAKFFDDIAEGLHEISSRMEGFDPADLQSNEEFISAVYEALAIAMKSSKKEKREYLANGVLNIAHGFKFRNVAEGAFFQMIDRFSVFHVTVLRIYQNPNLLDELFPDANSQIMGSMKGYIKIYMNKQGLSDDLIERVLDDVDGEKLVATYDLNGKPGSFSSKLKPIGEEFLEFISSPAEASAL